MKKILQAGIYSFSALIAAFSLISCREKIANDDKTLEIYTYLGGYGEDWLNKMAVQFEKLNPGVTVVVNGDPVLDKVRTKLLSGPKNNTTDLLFSGEQFFNLVDQGSNALAGYDCVLEQLDDVYETEVNGVKIKDMITKSYVDYHEIDNHYYSMSWADSLTGLVYNHTKFENAGLEIPLTTNQLFEVADKIKNKGEVAFISSTGVGYYEYLRETLHMQYEGIENYENFYRGIVDKKYSKDIFKQKGRLYSLEVIENIVAEKYARSHKDINSLTYPQSQTKFLIGEGYMMPNGDWLENELKKINDYNEKPQDIRMMKTPILSKIIERTPSIKDDHMLREVVKYVDGTIDYIPSGVTEEDINIIAAARNCIYTLGINHNAVIPVYATAKDLAKKFLVFMYTEEGIKIYQEETSGNSLPLKQEYIMNDDKYNNLSEFQKAKYNIIKNSVFGRQNFPMVYKGGLGAYVGERKNPEVKLAVKGGSSMTAQEIYDAEIEHYTDSVWNSMLIKAGLDE